MLEGLQSHVTIHSAIFNFIKTILRICVLWGQFAQNFQPIQQLAIDIDSGSDQIITNSVKLEEYANQVNDILPRLNTIQSELQQQYESIMAPQEIEIQIGRIFNFLQEINAEILEPFSRFTTELQSFVKSTMQFLMKHFSLH